MCREPAFLESAPGELNTLARAVGTAPEIFYSERPVHSFSGGERIKLAMARVMVGKPDVYLLDEPTNDLDIRTLTILEDYLDRFDGIVIVVSHDRYFLDRVTKRLFAFEPDGICQFEGNYSEYALVREMEQTQSVETSTKRGNAAQTEEQSAETLTRAQERERQGRTHAAKVKFTYKEQREYDTIEDDIAALEQRLEDIDNDMAANATNAAKLRELLGEKETTEQLLEEKLERWEYLEELAAKIAAQ